MSQPIIITGVAGGVHDRLEINDFIQNDKFFTLYIRALQALQDVGEDKDDSFFAIGGIHGEPHESWNGAPNAGRNYGYCAHGNVLFPTWHRPYMLLLEQLIHVKALECAGRFTTDKDSWRTAAGQLRQPYWDWIKNIVPPDNVIANSTVKITDYNGEKVDVDNPLLHYKFNNRHRNFKFPRFAGYPTTLRHPKIIESGIILPPRESTELSPAVYNIYFDGMGHSGSPGSISVTGHGSTINANQGRVVIICNKTGGPIRVAWGAHERVLQNDECMELTQGVAYQIFVGAEAP